MLVIVRMVYFNVFFKLKCILKIKVKIIDFIGELEYSIFLYVCVNIN